MSEAALALTGDEMDSPNSGESRTGFGVHVGPENAMEAVMILLPIVENVPYTQKHL